MFGELIELLTKGSSLGYGAISGRLRRYALSWWAVATFPLDKACKKRNKILSQLVRPAGYQPVTQCFFNLVTKSLHLRCYYHS